jgi:hypothetical protein
VKELYANGMPLKMTTTAEGHRLFVRPGADFTAPQAGMWHHEAKSLSLAGVFGGGWYPWMSLVVLYYTPSPLCCYSMHASWMSLVVL